MARDEVATLDESPMRTLGRRIEAARRRRGWSYRDFEQRTGMSRSTLQYLVRRRQTAPDYYELTALVKALGVTWDDEWERLWRRAVEAPTLDSEPAAQAPEAGPTPAQLPAEVFGFAGRATELGELNGLLDEPEGRPPYVAVVLCGTPGVGKTALAIRWARRARVVFPDGQLYVNLRGYDNEQPVTPGEALAGFLRALGVADRDVPGDLDGRAAAFRTLTEDRRLLVVLDNAAAAEQVRPLLPGATTCRVLVTSRDTLAGLVARDGARRLDLDLLPAADALALLSGLVGDRAVSEPDLAERLVELCARLPLALRIAAELAVSRPHTSLAEIVDELTDHQRRLDVLEAGSDPHTAVRTVFSWSYEHLDAAAARMFRLAGLHPGLDFDVSAAAALAGVELAVAARLLDRLVGVHLIQAADGRFGMHDLLRAYAAERAEVDESDPDRLAAVERLLEHYLGGATDAMNVLFPDELRVRPQPASAATPEVTEQQRASAMSWLGAERQNLVAACGLSAARDGRHAKLIAQTVARHLEVGAYRDEAVTIHRHALDAARRTDDLAAVGKSLNNLGIISLDHGRYDEAETYFRESLRAREAVGDLVGQGRTVNNLGIALERMGHYDLAQGCYERALAIRQGLSDQSGKAFTLGNLGVVCFRRGQHDQAIESLSRALELFRSFGNRVAEAYTLDNLATIDLRLGRDDEALERCRQALPIFREVGARDGEATSLGWIAVVATHREEYDLAYEHLEQALAIQREIGDRDGESLTLVHWGHLDARLGRMDDALDRHRRAVTVAEGIGDPDRHTHALNSLAETLRVAERTEEARHEHERALDLARSVGLRYEEDRALRGLAAIATP